MTFVLGAAGERWMHSVYYNRNNNTLHVRVQGETLICHDTGDTVTYYGLVWAKYASQGHVYHVRKLTLSPPPPLQLLERCTLITPVVCVQTRHTYRLVDQHVYKTVQQTFTEHPTTALVQRIIRDILHLCLTLFEHRLGLTDVLLTELTSDGMKVCNIERCVSLDDIELSVPTPIHPYTTFLESEDSLCARMIQTLYACIYCCMDIAVQHFGTPPLYAEFQRVVQPAETDYIDREHSLWRFYDAHRILLQDAGSLFANAVAFLVVIGNDEAVMVEENPLHTEQVIRHWLEFHCEH